MPTRNTSTTSLLRFGVFTTDNRDHYRNYSATVPYLGTAPTALLEGFAELPNLEIHVISCTQQPMPSPAKLANTIWFHSLPVCLCRHIAKAAS